jgi:hypothetical protein
MAVMKNSLRALLFAGFAIAAAGSAQPALAESTDGLWSVLIMTKAGTCDRGYRYPVRIRKGRVTHADSANSSFDISGRVRGNHIRVTVSRGSQSATGTGRINHDSGSGTWRTAAGDCSGQWTAERRG